MPGVVGSSQDGHTEGNSGGNFRRPQTHRNRHTDTDRVRSTETETGRHR